MWIPAGGFGDNWMLWIILTSYLHLRHHKTQQYIVQKVRVRPLQIPGVRGVQRTSAYLRTQMNTDINFSLHPSNILQILSYRHAGYAVCRDSRCRISGMVAKKGEHPLTGQEDDALLSFPLQQIENIQLPQPQTETRDGSFSSNTIFKYHW